jgi:hypothetical protein
MSITVEQIEDAITTLSVEQPDVTERDVEELVNEARYQEWLKHE